MQVRTILFLVVLLAVGPVVLIAARHIYRVTHPVLAMWQQPIEFYGKVVDEKTNPVAGATIKFHWVETPSRDGNRDATTHSDAAGLFSLRGACGPSLGVLVTKEGYYSPHKGFEVGFKYGSFAIDGFSPDRKNPVIFQLHKKGHGAELITSQNGIRPDLGVRLPNDNKAIRVDLLQKRASATGQLEISQLKPPLKEATEWSLRMTIPNGGFVEAPGEFAFEAPVRNYQPTVELQFKKSETNWTTQLDKDYYFAFGEPREYGRLHVESTLGVEPVYLTYVINPTGSRNLEPAAEHPWDR